jgi:hypothetical protein
MRSNAFPNRFVSVTFTTAEDLDLDQRFFLNPAGHFMSTKPTRQQEKACDQLANALLLIADAARLDGRASLDFKAFRDLANLLVKATSAFDLATVVSRSLEARGHSLGLRSGTSELLTLLDNQIEPLEVLLRSDDDFRGLVAKIEEELGEA